MTMMLNHYKNRTPTKYQERWVLWPCLQNYVHWRVQSITAYTTLINPMTFKRENTQIVYREKLTSDLLGYRTECHVQTEGVVHLCHLGWYKPHQTLAVMLVPAMQEHDSSHFNSHSYAMNDQLCKWPSSLAHKSRNICIQQTHIFKLSTSQAYHCEIPKMAQLHIKMNIGRHSIHVTVGKTNRTIKGNHMTVCANASEIMFGLCEIVVKIRCIVCQVSSH